MQNPQAVFGVPQPPRGLQSGSNLLPAPLLLPPGGGIAWRPAFTETQGWSPSAGGARCSEKGCVFPAAPGNSGQCLYHERQSREPVLFSSHQPTHVVLERVRFGSEAGGEVGAHSRDRKRLVELREAFLEE